MAPKLEITWVENGYVIYVPSTKKTYVCKRETGSLLNADDLPSVLEQIGQENFALKEDPIIHP